MNKTSSELAKMAEYAQRDHLWELSAREHRRFIWAIAARVQKMEATLELVRDKLRVKEDYAGERCPDFDPECLQCKIWKMIDELDEALAFDPLSHSN